VPGILYTWHRLAERPALLGLQAPPYRAVRDHARGGKRGGGEIRFHDGVAVGGGARATEASLSQFHELAEYYDAINDWKDYRGESKRLESIVRRFGPPGKTKWLDVACGTGRHLEHLSRRHPAVGVDGSAEMLRIARRRLPGVPLILGDMRSFRLHRRFDVVSCLFSAIGHLKTEKDVRRTFANFARHLNPGGIAIVEPWIDPTAFLPGTIHLRTHQSPGATVVRCAYSSRRGHHSIIQSHFLVGVPGRGIRYQEVTDVGSLIPRERLIRFMEEAGLVPHFIARGLLPGRGLLLGVKAGTGSAARTARPSGSHPRSRSLGS
jgi:ubiquinone/menaquinone biosynthesis C-methylase UbiE